MKKYNPTRSIRSAVLFSIVFLLITASLACSFATQIIAPPTATSLPSPVPSAIPPAKILYSDDFSDSFSGWLKGTPSDNLDSTFEYVDGEYILTRKKGTDSVNWSLANQNFSDSVISVDIRHISGDTNVTGPVIFWHISSDYQSFYWLLVYGNGQYSIQKVINGVSTIIQPWGPNSAILRGLKVNHIDIKSVGAQHTIYINGIIVADFTDSGSLHGDIALGVTATVLSNIEAGFDNLIVHNVENWAPVTNP